MCYRNGGKSELNFSMNESKRCQRVNKNRKKAENAVNLLIKLRRFNLNGDYQVGFESKLSVPN